MSEGAEPINEEDTADVHDKSADVSTAGAGSDSSKAASEKTKSPGSSSAKQKNPLKVDILLKPAGDAPIMSKRKWTVDRTKRISWVADFIKKYIKSSPSESLFLYVNQSFAPAPDADLGSIFDCFGSDGKLVLHYCGTQAWG